MWMAVACGSDTAPEVSQASVPRGRPDVADDMREDRDAARHPRDGAGRAWLSDGPATVAAGATGTWVVTFEVAPIGIAAGGSVVFQASPFWGWSPAQARDERAPGFTDVRCGTLVDVHDAGGLVVVRAVEAMPAGARCDFHYGAGAARARADTFAEDGAGFHVGVDGDGDGIRRVLAEPVVVETVAGPPAALLAHLPSTAEPGTVVTLRVAWVDERGNAPIVAHGPVELDLPEGLVGPTSMVLRDGIGRTELRAVAPGVYRVRAMDGSGRVAQANPLVVRRGISAVRWADLHAHSHLSDGTGSPEALFAYARDVAALDVFALTDHDHWGLGFLDERPDRWERIVRAARSGAVPGAFVALPGFEYTHWIDGHRHMVWFGDDVPPLASSMSPATERTEALWAALDGQPALVFPHHPAGGPVSLDWSRVGPLALEPVVEVASVHGQSESASSAGAIYDADPGAFVDRNLRVDRPWGFVGSGDGHDGHPGLTHLVGGRGGLTAVVGADLEADALRRALQARSCYATTGQRIFVSFDVGGLPMGATSAPLARAEASLRVVGTDVIERVDLVRRAGVVGSAPGGDLLLHARWALDGLQDDYVYVRVRQADGAMAWTSPIWFTVR